MDIAELNQALAQYDKETYAKLDLVLQRIAIKSKALASNLKDCFEQFRLSDRYLRAYNGESIPILENQLIEEEFMIFRKYVRLLRSCTIMCGQELSQEFKVLFLDFFSGTRVKLAKELAKQQ